MENIENHFFILDQPPRIFVLVNEKKSCSKMSEMGRKLVNNNFWNVMVDAVDPNRNFKML